MSLSKRVFKKLAILFGSFTAFILLLATYQLDVVIFSLITIVAAVICILTVYWYTKVMLKPVDTITSQIRELAQNKAEELSETTHREFTQTFSSLNILLDRLHKYETELSRNKKGFNTIIESIKEAIWIQNKSGFITISNQSFNRMVGQPNVQDRYFWNVIRSIELYEVADRVFKNPGNFTENLSVEDKQYLCSTSYSSATQETVFILYDITEISKLETIKKDLIRNVSHELRTPLTSIKGYLETFEDELTDEQKNYVEIIKRNTDRLIHIVNDLLTLSHLEHDRSIELEELNIKTLLTNLDHVFAHRAKRKGLTLIKLVHTKTNFFMADRFKIEQVLINLIDNAIKYTEKGEIKIEVLENKNDFIFTISDTGVGIDQIHIPRLFERFYVVDKSRSRRVGGTGLGLSIVKHIIQLHNGEIEVKSTKGEGTTFEFSIPKLVQ